MKMTQQLMEVQEEAVHKSCSSDSISFKRNKHVFQITGSYTVGFLKNNNKNIKLN